MLAAPGLSSFLALIQVLLIDLSMAGDNALVVGMAAAGLPAAKRHRAVLAGILGATVLRILFALFAVQILRITGMPIAGGLLLLWVAWKMWQELRREQAMQHKNPKSETQIDSAATAKAAEKTLGGTIIQIIIADVSMSLDNVLGVAGVARHHVGVLVLGLTLSVLIMGLASTLVARLAARHSWVGYVGVAIVLLTALRMVWDGSRGFF